MSESLDDTDEGFDVTVPQELRQAGDAKVYVVKPKAKNVTPCKSSPDGYEPWASAIVWWN